jgi:hypothetical protein
MSNTLAQIVKELKSLVVAAAKLNQKERQEIREVVGELLDTLCDGLDMTIVYMNHAKHARDHELVEHLLHAREVLRRSFSEFKVCGGLYNLRDRFSRIFDPVRASISVGHIKEIGYLVNDLACGERSILDFLEDRGIWMTEQADKMASMTPGSTEWQRARTKLLADLQSHIAVLQDKRNELKRDVRHLIDNL